MRCSDLVDGCSASSLFEEEGLWRTSKCLTKLFSIGDLGVKKNGVTEISKLVRAIRRFGF